MTRQKIGALLTSCVLLLGMPARALAQTDFDYRAQVETDLRVTVPGTDQPDSAHHTAFDRNQNAARLTAAFSWGSVAAMADLAVVYSGLSQVDQIDTLTQRGAVDPYYFESDAMFVEVIDFVFPGVDLRIGRQIIQWGSADLFNPTSVISGYDLEDPIDFGRQVANESAALSINPGWNIDGEETAILDEVNLTIVTVPVFRSGLIPYSALVAFEDPQQFARFVNSKLLNDFIGVEQTFVEKGGTLEYRSVTVREPDARLSHAQIGSRLRFSLVGFDMSAMYYHGYDHNLQATRVGVESELLSLLPASDDIDVQAIENMINILPDGGLVGQTVITDVDLFYPEVHVVGADMATSLDWLGGMGLWAEFAMTYHDGVPIAFSVGELNTVDTQVAPGEFWKLTTGIDFTFTKWLYANVQYLHGFIDEFGTENIGDYIVAGADFKTFDEQVLLRLFGILQLQDESFVAFPQLTFKFWQNTDLMAGALLHGGSDDSKFGSQTAGPNIVFLKGKYAF